jgi:hypothetical protein
MVETDKWENRPQTSRQIPTVLQDSIFFLNMITVMIPNKCSMSIYTTMEFKRWINSAIYYF